MIVFYKRNNLANNVFEFFYKRNNFANNVFKIFYEGNNFANNVFEIFYEGNNFANKVFEIVIHIILSTNQNLTMRGLNKVTLIGNLGMWWIPLSIELVLGFK